MAALRSAVAVCGQGPQLPILNGPGTAHALVHPGVGARDRAMHVITLSPGAGTVDLCHPGDAVYYVLKGSGEVCGTRSHALSEGAMAHIDAGQTYVLAAGDQGLGVVGGPAPVDPALYDSAATATATATATVPEPQDGIRLFHRDRPDMRMPMISSDARLVVWPGVGAHRANMNYVVMQAGEENVPHVHPRSEDTIYIVEGHGTVRDLDAGTVTEYTAGQAIFVPPGVSHQVRADGGVRVVSVGGPCPPDYEMLRRLGATLDTA